ncbi:uncharacterized protein MELLADRAFT_94532 [Melampsora larici-populina 98AG31]|uniref:Uncharacterized protein n=1 Tax=Melampsora larici-populina (strain 98AG31 / pathotype 3-4-7) TaxID=747676 RepID=F4RBR6_MELLP|nr:uncharacterized protein MELLADRAFT_94532 [Melampsora larici-populina 98AG31]EGG10150.1 hypothetical protein MELLADRAFT_94532 [Melampsora larici-populina 98AG31]
MIKTGVTCDLFPNSRRSWGRVGSLRGRVQGQIRRRSWGRVGSLLPSLRTYRPEPAESHLENNNTNKRMNSFHNQFPSTPTSTSHLSMVLSFSGGNGRSWNRCHDLMPVMYFSKPTLRNPITGLDLKVFSKVDCVQLPHNNYRTKGKKEGKLICVVISRGHPFNRNVTIKYWRNRL